MKEMADWFLKPFGLLDTVKARWQLVIFCGVFGCVFLTVFQPFDMENWFPKGKTSLFNSCSSFFSVVRINSFFSSSSTL